MDEVIQHFLEQECDSRESTDEILSDIHQDLAGGIREIREWTFNWFSVRIDYTQGTVVIEDPMDEPGSERCTVSLSEFQAALGAHAPKR